MIEERGGDEGKRGINQENLKKRNGKERRGRRRKERVKYRGKKEGKKGK